MRRKHIIKAMSILVFVFFVISANAMTTPAVSASIPTIEFTNVPQYGSFENVQGRVTNVTPADYKVSVYKYVSGWWTKPTFQNPLTSINPDGSWSCDITTGGYDQYATKVKAYLIPNGYNPPQLSGQEIFPPELELKSVASIEAVKKAERRILFSGLEWIVKSSIIPVGPGLNYFSDSTQSVRVDGEGQLHLKIININGKWHSAEVISVKSFGYGKYIFHIASRIDQIDKNAVLGLFTWDDSAPQYHYREIDIEASKWGQITNDNMQYVVQPWNVASNMHRFNMVLSGANSTHSFDWKPDIITFLSLEGKNVIGSWVYSGNDIPPPGVENVRMNLWLFDPNNVLGLPPSDGKEVEVVINRFEFIPPGTCNFPEGKNLDMNHDGSIGIGDVVVLINNWGEADGTIDLNNDGTIGIGDVVVLVNNWGKSC